MNGKVIGIRYIESYMDFKDRTSHALGIAVLVWAVCMTILAIAGLATGVWHLSDLWSRGIDFLIEFGLMASLGTFLLVGGPVFLWQQNELIAPISGLVCYVAFWVVIAMGGGISALYVAILYGPYALVGFALLAICEWILRTVAIAGVGRIRNLIG